MRKNGLKTRIFSIALALTMAVSSTYVAPTMEVRAEKGEGTVYAKNKYDSNYDAQNAYQGNDLGCTYTKEKTTFKVWSPAATKIVLCRYEKGNGGSVIEEKEMTKGEKGVWSITIDGDIVNTYYTYKVTANGSTKEAVDIYAKAAGVNGVRSMVVDLENTNPEGWQEDMALISQPRILFLDEPTLGLDVLARRELWDVIRSLKGRVTIILTTHYLEEAEALSDRIGIMKEGHLLAVGTAQALKAMAETDDFEQAFISIVREGKA